MKRTQKKRTDGPGQALAAWAREKTQNRTRGTSLLDQPANAAARGELLAYLALCAAGQARLNLLAFCEERLRAVYGIHLASSTVRSWISMRPKAWLDYTKARGQA